MRELYTFFRSSTSYRLRIALSVKGLDWQPRFVSLPKMEHRGETYLATNPQGLVPILIDDGMRLTQTLAVIEYLEERYPEPPLLPSDPIERAYVRALGQIIACDIHPLNNARVLKLLRGRFALGEDDVQDWYAHWIETGFSAFEAMLVSEGRAGTCCLGDRLTLADICLVPQVANARRFSCDLTPYPALTAIADRAARLDIIAQVAPHMQPDAF